MKRIFDVIVSAVVLLMATPLLLGIGILVTTTSPGGPFFR